MPAIRARNYLLRLGETPADCLVVNGRVRGLFRLAEGGEEWEEVDEMDSVEWGETAVFVLANRTDRYLPPWARTVLEAISLSDPFAEGDGDGSDVGLLLAVKEATLGDETGEEATEPEGDDLPGSRSRWLVWSFGSGYLNFDRRRFVPDYGVRSVLNAAARIADASGATPTLKAVRYVVGGATRQRAFHTAMESLQPGEFRMNTIADLLAGAGVAAHPLAGSADGTMGLVGNFDLADLDQIRQLSTELIRLYDENLYEQAFSFFAHRRPVVDIGLEFALDGDLYDALVGGHNRVSGVLPSLDEGTVDVAYLAFPHESTASAPTAEPNRHSLAAYAAQYGNVAFFEASIRLLDSNRQLITRRFAKDFLYAELERDGRSYVFSEGVWYEVEQDYLEGLRARLDSLRCAHDDAWPEYTNETEPVWLGLCGAVTDSLLVLDRQLIDVPGESSIEAADLIDLNGRLVHVKRRRESSKTAYVFDQAVSSMTVLARSPAARDRLLERIEQNPRGAAEEVLEAARTTIAEIAAGNPVEVVVALLGSGGSANPADLPLNTKIAADDAARSLASLRADLHITHWGIGLH